MTGRRIASTRLSGKGQVVIPKAIRDEYGWRDGLELIVEATDEGVVLRPRALTRTRAAQELLGCTGYKGPRVSLSEMDAAITREARARK
jgi:AbrB family looped-hinge helix DNA binding protein